VGIDLFNHGFYWEAHEVWEGLWNAAGRRGVIATFLKGLIKLAATGVKWRERRDNEGTSHPRRAREHFVEVMAQLSSKQEWFAGLSLKNLIEFSEWAMEPSRIPRGGPIPPVEIVFPFVLRPQSRSPVGEIGNPSD
jgi:hypothetical protein